MSRVERSIAMTAEINRRARGHLVRPDRQEDICFGLWRGSRGQTRTTALIERLILPHELLAPLLIPDRCWRAVP